MSAWHSIIIGRILVDLTALIHRSDLEQVWLSARTSIICTGSNKMYNKLKLWAPKHSSGTGRHQFITAVVEHVHTHVGVLTYYSFGVHCCSS